MKRTSGLILALAAGLAASACASGGSAGPARAVPTPTPAQGQPSKSYPPGLAKPTDNTFTTKAELMIVKAEATKDTAQKMQDFQDVITTVQQGMQQDSLNPKLWYQAGQGYVGLGDYARADSVFARAQQIYPAYEPDINAEREQAWVEQFNEGVKAMQANDDQGAISHLEKAQFIYHQRPEALLNLASLYLRTKQPVKAADAYQQVLKIVNGPARQQMPAKVTQDWGKYEKLAETNLPQVYASIGVGMFQAQHYDSAAVYFGDALKINPYYRDALHNLSQALYLQTSALEQREDSVPAAQKQDIQNQLRPLYDQFRKVAERTEEIDPYDGNVLLLLARAYRGLGLLATTDSVKKQWQDKALAVLQKHQNMPFQITNLRVSMADTAVALQGQLQNMTLKKGQTVTLKFTMLDAQGNAAGSQQVTVTAPAKESATAFQLTVPVAAGESVLGWKYEVIS